MSAAYLFCLVVGGALAALSAFGHPFGDADADVHLDALHADGLGAAGDAPGGPAEIGYLTSIFSVRALIFALLGFGATGSLLGWLGADPGATSTVALATGAGLTVGGVVGAFLGYLKRSDTGPRQDESSFVGLTGRVTLPLGEGAAGRVVVTRGGREHTVRALPFPEHVPGDPAAWTHVLVVEMRRGIAYVEPLDAESRRLLEPGN